eukprot:COSAG01_NODE_3844_length_5645_cov_8.301479_1_plen_67_part_00
MHTLKELCTPSVVIRRNTCDESQAVGRCEGPIYRAFDSCAATLDKSCSTASVLALALSYPDGTMYL